MNNKTTGRTTRVQGIWLRWTLTNFAAVMLAILAVLPVVVNLAYANQPVWLRGAVAGAVLGMTLGIGQGWVLHHTFSVSALWIILSFIGGAMGLAGGLQLAEYTPLIAVTQSISRADVAVLAAGTALRATVSGLLFGLSLGLWQWFLLRQHASNAAWWIIANAIGWSVSLGLAALVAANGVIYWLLIAGSINGVITGWLLHQWLNTGNSPSSLDLA
jgi:hypothetical protein